ncbi:MAG TPA: glycerate kinase [Candidatus Lustribacter sp.]|nr:glycerate kinase [Candidatus Lustribacter sp.]
MAPDKFKGSCTAREAADAIVLGLRDAWGDGPLVTVIPMADGGEGTVAAFIDGGAVAQHVPTTNALGAPVDATYARLGPTAIIEMAAASGLAMLAPPLAPRLATTYGTGTMIADALARGATRVVLGIGGSATTDGGAGALAALGVRFLDAAGTALAPTPAALARVASIDAAGLDPRLAGASIEIAADVHNPLLGPNGAAAVYGPQKGATPDDVAFLDGVLARLADLATAVTGRDLRDRPGAGAAGGLGWGLATFAGARLVGGFDVVAQLTGLAAALAGAALCVTGEGRIDRQSLDGKVVAGIARLAGAAGVEVLAIGGSVDPQVEPELRARGVTCIALIVDPAERERAMREAPAFIRAATARWARGRPVPA